MRVFTTRNTNTMAKRVYPAILAEGIHRPSRNGDVLAFPSPVTFHYTHPEEMVNVCPIRDANPFFHLMEAVAMMANYNDVDFLTYFCSNMAQYSDDGKTFNAFYGTRMGTQYNQVISLLHKDMHTRQAVIQLWDQKDLLKNTKDKACNMSMVFSIIGMVLDMTVYCRSNDLIYGGVTGANVVHFPFIHACMANELDCIQGEFYHVVNNAHVYVDNPHFQQCSSFKCLDISEKSMVDIDCTRVELLSLFESMRHLPPTIRTIYTGSKFLNTVILPMYNTFMAHKTRNQGLYVVNDIKDEAWKLAATQWLKKREV